MNQNQSKLVLNQITHISLFLSFASSQMKNVHLLKKNIIDLYINKVYLKFKSC